MAGRLRQFSSATRRALGGGGDRGETFRPSSGGGGGMDSPGTQGAAHPQHGQGPPVARNAPGTHGSPDASESLRRQPPQHRGRTFRTAGDRGDGAHLRLPGSAARGGVLLPGRTRRPDRIIGPTGSARQPSSGCSSASWSRYAARCGTGPASTSRTSTRSANGFRRRRPSPTRCSTAESTCRWVRIGARHLVPEGFPVLPAPDPRPGPGVVRRRAKPASARASVRPPGQSPGARRADERSRHRNARGTRGTPRGIRGNAAAGKPRSSLSRQPGDESVRDGRQRQGHRARRRTFRLGGLAPQVAYHRALRIGLGGSRGGPTVRRIVQGEGNGPRTAPFG